MAGAGCLICFDPLQGQLLAILSADNRLRLWDVVSGTVRQQYVEAQHLSKHFSAIAWHRPSSASAGKRRRSSSTDSAAPLGVIALGSEAGGVSIWDLQRGVQTTLTDGNARAPISCMAFSSDGSKLYTASSTDKDVVEWSVESSKILRKLKGLSHGAAQLAMHPSGESIAVAGSTIKLMGLAKGKSRGKLSIGQGASITDMVFTADGRYLLCCARGSRFITVLSCTDDGRVVGTPVASLPLPDLLKHVDAHCQAGQHGAHDILTILAVGLEGGAQVMRLHVTPGVQDAGNSGGAPANAEICKVIVPPQGRQQSPNCIRACLMPRDSRRAPTQVMVAHGRPAAPVLEMVDIVDDESKLKPTVQLERVGAAKGSKAGPGSAALTASSGTSAPVTVVGGAHLVAPGEAGMKGTEHDALAAATAVQAGSSEQTTTKKAKRSKSASAGDALAAAAGDRDAMEQQLQALSMAFDNARNPDDGTGSITKGLRNAAEKSRAVLKQLLQALHAKDEDLLQRCLSVTDPEIVDGVVNRLPRKRVQPLYRLLVEQFEATPARGTSYSVWVHSMLSHHMSHIGGIQGMESAPKSKPPRTGLIELLQRAVDQRLPRLEKLLAVTGRLDLVLSHVPATPAANAAASANSGSDGESDNAGRETGEVSGQRDTDAEEDAQGTESEASEAGSDAE
eukprot:TRINITY_DN2358_c0_g1_i2.p1 TRINITY_DN2358_c0_g1~~TRINITY_DN2358_c0_g1_i2.p1  ORF type:complete len:694 (+),score=125.65 TRINITY_DN2358_c0_g1_i2:51-2084(+)